MSHTIFKMNIQVNFVENEYVLDKIINPTMSDKFL